MHMFMSLPTKSKSMTITEGTGCKLHRIGHEFKDIRTRCMIFVAYNHATIWQTTRMTCCTEFWMSCRMFRKVTDCFKVIEANRELVDLIAPRITLLLAKGCDSTPDNTCTLES
ncbi:hypothetical protein Drorol1_Dr00012225 [Drosera rotundifolia]